MATKLPKVNAKTSDFIPCSESELRYIFLDQPGRENQSGRMCLTANIFVKDDNPGLAKLQDFIQKFWDENKLPGMPKKPKSNGIRKVHAKDEDGEDILDDNDNPTYTGECQIGFSTSAQWPAKGDKPEQPVKIKIFNAKGNEVQLGDKKIGTGSLGAVSFTVSIYDHGKSAQGVTLYFSAIQLTKFVEYVQEAGFEAEEGDFDGVPTEFDEVGDEAKPRL